MPNPSATRRDFLLQAGALGLASTVNLAPTALPTIAAAETTSSPNKKLVGMYVHQHWPYQHPYAARTWTIDDWRGYARALRLLGYNALMIWPVLETMPDPLTPSDAANLQKIASVIDILHDELGMRAYIALCPNVVANNTEAAKAPFEKRHFFYCDERLNPADKAAVERMIAWRAQLFAHLKKADGVVIIDSDPGGYPDSTNEEFVDLLCAHRAMLDKLRPGIELIYWMHVGWQGYGRLYKTGVLKVSTDAENLDVLSRLKDRNPEPWGIANGLQYARELGLTDRVINFNYGRIEGEPSFPMTNFGGTNAYKGGAAPGARGVMGNCQTHCVQLPNTFAFARGAAGKPIVDADYIEFASRVLPGSADTIVRAWQAVGGTASDPIDASIAELKTLPPKNLTSTGDLRGLLFGSPERFMSDLALMLRVRQKFLALQQSANPGPGCSTELHDFVTAAKAWQQQHGYENNWYWPQLNDLLLRTDSDAVKTVITNRFNPFAKPRQLPGETPFQYVARTLRETETYTPRLLDTLSTVCDIRTP